MKQSLKSDGILILHDYVGPLRLHWKQEQLDAANNALQMIPPIFRTKWKTNTLKKHIFRPGWWRMNLSDPSEAVESDLILPIIYQHFHIQAEKKIGGDLLHLILKDISHHYMKETTESSQILTQLFEIEDIYLQNKPYSDFMFGVYTKK